VLHPSTEPTRGWVLLGSVLLLCVGAVVNHRKSRERPANG
jgi:hypothetical protein